MKFLDSEKLDTLNSMLSVETDDIRIETKIEMYSCKMVNQDKRLFKEMLRTECTTANELQALSPSADCESSSPLSFSPKNGLLNGFSKYRHVSGSSEPEADSEGGGPSILCDAINRKKLFDLIGVLNASFPDYDFSAAKGENFSRITCFETVKHLIDGKFASVALIPYSTVQQKLWSVVDDCINLKACKFYTYNPDYESDPYSEDGCTWSFNYFCYNSQMKRVLFFTCRAFSSRACDQSEDLELEEEM